MRTTITRARTSNEASPATNRQKPERTIALRFFINEDIEIAHSCVEGTNPKASCRGGILGEARRVSLRNFRIAGGPSHQLTANVPVDRYNTTGWTYNGPQADHIGYK